MPNKERDIKIAVVGLGKMGRFHLAALDALLRGELESYYKGDLREIFSKVVICGLCDSSPDARTSLGYRVFADYRDLVQSAKPDMVIIATPTETHFEIARLSLNCGAHVFVEKPIVVSNGEFDELLRLASEKQLKLMAGHVERYNPVALKLKHILAESKPSNIAFNFTRTQPHDNRIGDDIVIDKLIHDLDLSLYLFGELHNYEILSHKKVDGRVSELKIRTEHEGSVGEIFVSWLNGSDVSRKIELTSADRLISGDFLNKTLMVNGQYVNCSVPRWISAENNQLKDELVDFIAYCFSESSPAHEPLLSVGEIACTVKIIERISVDLA